jgi:hypothetical protein
MMGPKKLADIKRAVRRALQQDQDSIGPWVDEQLASQETAKTNQRVIEDLLWVRDNLRKSAARKKRVRKPPVSRRR